MAIAVQSRNAGASRHTRGASKVTPAQVWAAVEKASFMVVAYATPSGESRSSGVVYKAIGRRLYFVVAPESWKARHIASSPKVSVTVPVRRGGLLALLWPIPPATVSFHATAVVHAAGAIEVGSIPKELETLLPDERREAAVLIELIPRGDFLAYGIGVSLASMRDPALAGAVVPVDREGALKEVIT
jgi:Pyridoxamine 5'-phosphate oxidase